MLTHKADIVITLITFLRNMKNVKGAYINGRGSNKLQVPFPSFGNV